jgi:hypothetical protein
VDVEVEAPERFTSGKIKRFNFVFYVSDIKEHTHTILHMAVELLSALES